jgi:CopG family nickel-responsive transcriptional regulator
MTELIRFGVAIPADLLEQFDRLIMHKGYGNRSEAIRDLGTPRDAVNQESPYA